MSSWTAINAAIRFDHLSVVQGPFDPFFGHTCTYEDGEAEWEQCDVPNGSEGSLQYKYVEYPDNENALVQGSLVIWGDLRDFEEADHPQVIEYLTRICEDREVRSGIAQLNEQVYAYDRESSTWKKA